MAVNQEAVDAYLELTKKLDETIAEYGNDSAEADVVRDEMDKPWYALTDEDMKYVDAQLTEDSKA